MQIGQVIRKYRKLKNLTQEEMANRIGVTAPAVNKWENGNSLPDITLLLPIARLLDISLDTLLSFRDELTVEEISGIIEETNSRLKNDSYEEVFQWAKEKLEQYPNCERLIWQMALALDSWRVAKELPDSSKYDDCIYRWYACALKSDDDDIRNAAADSLFGFYFRKEQYDKAEEYLTYFSKQNPERKRKQAQIFSKTNRIPEAYKAYEELMFSGYNMLYIVLNSIYLLAMRDKNMEKAHMLVEKQCELAKVFEMGDYHEAATRLDIAVAEKNVDLTLDTMEKILSSVDTLCDFVKSPLYEHMSFKNPPNDFIAELRTNLLESFKDEETYGFLKADERWKKLN